MSGLWDLPQGVNVSELSDEDFLEYLNAGEIARLLGHDGSQVLEGAPGLTAAASAPRTAPTGRSVPSTGAVPADLAGGTGSGSKRAAGPVRWTLAGVYRLPWRRVVVTCLVGAFFGGVGWYVGADGDTTARPDVVPGRSLAPTTTPVLPLLSVPYVAPLLPGSVSPTPSTGAVSTAPTAAPASDRGGTAAPQVPTGRPVGSGSPKSSSESSAGPTASATSSATGFVGPKGERQFIAFRAEASVSWAVRMRLYNSDGIEVAYWAGSGTGGKKVWWFNSSSAERLSLSIENQTDPQSLGPAVVERSVSGSDPDGLCFLVTAAGLVESRGDASTGGCTP